LLKQSRSLTTEYLTGIRKHKYVSAKKVASSVLCVK